MNLCKFLGHKPTWMSLGDNSNGFSCWRCGVRLGWDGNCGFSVWRQNGIAEMMSLETFKKSKTFPLNKTDCWYSVLEGEKSIGISLTPMRRPKWASREE